MPNETLTEKQILEPVRAFLLTYPYKTPVKDIAIDHGKVDQSDRSGEGNALRLTGRTRIGVKRSITGKVTTTWRVNLSLVMWRDTNANEFIRDIGEFILNFMQWVNDENAKRGTSKQSEMLPCFSDTDKEIISADGGGQTAMLPEERREYQIALHLDYQTVIYTRKPQISG